MDKSLATIGNAPGKPCKSSLFSCLLRNMGASFPHTLGGLPAGNTLAAIRAVFNTV